jgi:hypothetical protein
MNLCELATLSGLERFGSYDYAVPYDWLMKDPEKRRPHFWWYPRTPEVLPPGYRKSYRKPGSLMGRPLKWAAVARLALRMLRRGNHDSNTSTDLHLYMEVWKICYPGKPLDAHGEKLVREFLADSPDKEEYRAFIIEFVFQHMEIPAPGWLLEMTPDKSANSQAA